MIQLAELLFGDEPVLDFDAILADMRRSLGPSLEAQVSDDGRGRLIVHPCADGGDGAPARTAVMPSPEAPSVERFAGEVEQSWRCPDAARRVQGARHAVLVTEVEGRGQSRESRTPARRALRFHATLEAVLRHSNAHAAVVRSSQQVISREDYLEGAELPPLQRPGGLNIRVYGVESGGVVMDTLGMEALGLDDLQCRFRDLGLEEVARVLFNTAWYLFETGSTIEDGQTISGREQDEQWSCRFESSVAAPDRRLLDLNPGAPYALGEHPKSPGPEAGAPGAE